MSQDTVTLGGLAVQNQLFAECSSIAGMGQGFNQGPPAGLLGLAFNSISVDGAPTVFSMMIHQGLVQTPEFAFYLSATDQSDGELVLGGSDPAHYTGTLNYIPVLSDSYWVGALDAITIKGQSMTSQPYMFVDTGTSLIGGPNADVAAIAAAVGATLIPGGGGFDQYTIPCSAISSLPPIVFKVGGVEYSLSGSQYVLNDGQCTFGLFGAATPDNMWVLGDVFMRVFTQYLYTTPNSIQFVYEAPVTYKYSSVKCTFQRTWYNSAAPTKVAFDGDRRDDLPARGQGAHRHRRHGRSRWMS